MHELPTLYQQQIHTRHYARWDDNKGRRETWDETVDRYIQQITLQSERYDSELTLAERAELRDSILHTRVMPSMRAMMTAGPALERDNVAGYNCAYMAIDDPRAFDEALFILCCGTGVGFSVERQHTDKLPEIPAELHSDKRSHIIVEDSKEGWATAFRVLLSELWQGRIPTYDTSLVRPAGSRLKTFGGRASGPQPLIDLFEYTVEVFKQAAGRKLTSAEAHGIMCKIGDIVVVGGVRRSALISLYDPADDEMAHIKDGAYWERAPHLRLANNSAVWTEKPTYEEFLEQQWRPLVEGKSGEPGIVNRSALQRKAAKTDRRDPTYQFGTNPCGEIILRSCQFCNLSEIVARPEDNFDDLIRKARQATILGVLQSTLTNFRYLRPIWQQNCEEERLLGVSITGAMDHPVLNGNSGMPELRSWLHALRHVVVDTAREYSERWGINMPAATSCNKPSGTVAKLVYSGAGMNEWHDKRFIQRQRGHKSDPAAQLLYYQGVPAEDDVMDPENTWVFSWAMKAPDGALTRKEMPARRKLDLWLAYAEEWCEHNPSTTINVREDEWEDLGEAVYENFDQVAGIAFLPSEDGDHVYQQAPFESITEEQYRAMKAEEPTSVDWSLLSVLESDDHTEGAQELACIAGACTI